MGSHDHRRVSEVSQDREVTTPLSIGTFESELNDAVGIMAMELRVLLDPAKQLPEINLAVAWCQMFFVAPVAVGEPYLLAAC